MHLNCHSYYSLKFGTLSIEELLYEAQGKSLNTLALTDINNTSGVLDFVRLAPKYGIRPVVGIDFRKGAQQLYIGIAKNNEGFRQLNEHLSAHLMGGEPLQSRAPLLPDAFVIYPFGTISAASLRENEYVGVRPEELRRLPFGEWAQHPEKLVALKPATFRHKRDFNIHRLLRTMDNNTLLSKLPLSEQSDPDDIMRSEEQLEAIYRAFPHVLQNAKELLEQCSISFDYSTNKNKKSYTGSEQEDIALLEKNTWEGLHYRYGKPNQIILDRLEKELRIIKQKDFVSYFLINWDLVTYARRRGFFYVGRGSGANSMVAYCLRITDVDPIELDLYFERFINPSRSNPPDFDLDFSWRDRDEITKYLFDKYGRDHTALLATYSTFQHRAVIRELGKVFGLPKHEIDTLADEHSRKGKLDKIAMLVLRYGQYIRGFPSHLSIHAGGILISEEPMTSYTALNLPPKGFPTTQFSMLEAEDIGLHKFDILSQRGLGHIREAIDIVRQNRGVNIDIHDIKKLKKDPDIKALLRTGNTMGCFYVESPAMRMLLKKLEVDNYLGLVAASSIIRPGVAQSGMMREYILRYRDPERRKLAHPAMWKIMPDTYGIMVYQEDVIKVAHYYAGLTLTESDVLRRGMSGKYRSRAEFQKVKDRFFSNCKEKGYDPAEVAEIWRQIESFAGYSFAKGHSASYAVESYQSLYLKAHFPLEFMVGVVNNFGGFYRTEYYLHEAKMAGARILAPCINHSEHQTAIRGKDVYLGFVHVRDVEGKTIADILEERLRRGPFKSIDQFVERVHTGPEQLRSLVRVGAFRSTHKTKKELLWQVALLLGPEPRKKYVYDLFEEPPTHYELPKLHYYDHEDAFDEVELLGFPLSDPFVLLAEVPEEVISVREMKQHLRKPVRMMGYMVHVKHTSTSSGKRMYFGTFLDQEGQFLDSTHFPRVAEKFPFRGKGIYLMTGKVEEEFGFYSIEVHSMEKLKFKRDERYSE